MLFEHPLQAKIGIRIGAVSGGVVGTRTQKNTTEIGNVVNFASRIESANIEFGTTIVVSAIFIDWDRIK